MTYRPRIQPRAPSKRERRNYNAAFAAFASGATEAPVMEPIPPRRSKPKRQIESASNDAVKAWAKLKGGVLYRNVRGQAGKLPPLMRVGLGPNGFGDNVGYLTITVTPGMVNKRIAVFAMVECKRADKALKTPDPNDLQLQMIEEVRDAGGIAGYARQADDAEALLAGWKERVSK